MGYAFVYSPCAGCGRVFAYNPVRVPSVRVRGEREPVCRLCIEAANTHRAANGIPALTYHPDAYEPIAEEDLP